MKLKLNNDTLLMDACIWLTLLYQNYLELAEPNYCRKINRPDPTDQLYHGAIHQGLYMEQVSLKSFYSDVKRAWDFQVGSKDIKVAVIDNGLDWTHCDFGITEPPFGPGKKIADGYNYMDNSKHIIFQSAHGTNVAGIIGALTNWSSLIGCDSYGIAGIAGGWYGEVIFPQFCVH